MALNAELCVRSTEGPFAAGTCGLRVAPLTLHRAEAHRITAEELEEARAQGYTYYLWSRVRRFADLATGRKFEVVASVLSG